MFFGVLVRLLSIDVEAAAVALVLACRSCGRVETDKFARIGDPCPIVSSCRSGSDKRCPIVSHLLRRGFRKIYTLNNTFRCGYYCCCLPMEGGV